VQGEAWEDVFYTLLENGSLSRLDHAAYLGKELFKAELAIRLKRSFEQDGPF
jgi:dihydropteroate synthase